MPRMTSDIFEQYAKLAEEQGLIKLGKDSKELEEYKNSDVARVGSDDQSTIELLYGVKPNGDEYEENIAEIAHPNAVVIVPSYDKLNALVENVNERHNISRNIVEKQPDGNLGNPKYARKELIMELVRVANEMDARSKEELFKLADECLIGLNKEALSFKDFEDWFKDMVGTTGEVAPGVAAGAGIGAAVGGLITAWTGPGILAGVPTGAAIGAALGGIITGFAKTTPQVKNVEENAKEVLEQLQDLHKKLPEQNEFFAKIKEAVDSLIVSAKEYQELLNKIRDHGLKGETVSDIEKEEAHKVADKFLKDVALVEKYKSEFYVRANSGAFAKAESGKVLKPIYWFIDDDIDDVKDAFASLDTAVNRLKEATKEQVGAAASKPLDKPNAKEPKPTMPTQQVHQLEEMGVDLDDPRQMGMVEHMLRGES